jgi:single-strand DNA-binding protein
MAKINKVEIEGNLTRDAESKYTNTGKCVASFSIAYNDDYKKGDEWIKQVSYFDVTVLGKEAENAASLRKGTHVNLTGKLKQDRWEKEGKVQSKVYIVAFEVYAEGAKEGRSEAPKPRPVQSAAAASGDDFTDDIPF